MDIREESLAEAIKRSGKTSETLRRSGGFEQWRLDRKAGKLHEDLCKGCDAFGDWVASEVMKGKDCADTEAMVYQGAWVYFYENYKDWRSLTISPLAHDGEDEYLFTLDTQT